MSLRLRLALFIAAAIAVSLLAQGVLGYISFERSLYATLDGDLRGYLFRLIERDRFERDRPESPFGGYVSRARLVQDQKVLQQWGTFPSEVPIPTSSTPSTIRTVGNWRVGTLDLGEGFFLQAALQSEQVISSLDNYRNTVLLTALAVVLASTLIAWLLAGPALRPLRHLLKATTQVAASGDLGQRVPTGGAGELKTLSQTFNHMMERLSAFRQRETQFTRNASHELRTPLTAITLQLSALDQGYASPQETLAVVREEVERMTRLTESLLTLAREGRGQKVGLDLAALAQELAQSMGAAYNGPAQLSWQGDPILLRQALFNLLDNARKYAPQSPAHLSLEAADPFVVLRVADAGPGLGPEARARATEAFFRAAGTRAPGVGLGLSVVAQIAEVHGGRLELRPNQPQGLIAELWLSRNID